MRSWPTGLALIAALAGGSSVATAPEQPVPGQLTQARVWVQNRGHDQAVPVDLREVNTESPLRVQVVNGDPASKAPNPALVRLGRQQWEYATATVAGGASAAMLLGERGTEGWETTGIAWTTADGTTLLLKRPR